MVICLGEDEEAQSADGQLMHRLSNECFYRGKAAEICCDMPGDREALKKLFARSYWRRIWVVQEVILSKQKANVMLGG